MLETGTFALTLLPLLVAALIVLLVNWRIHHGMRGPGYWAAGAAIRFAGMILIACRGWIPDFFSVILGDLLVIGGDVVILYGLCGFAGRKMFNWAPLVVSLAAFIGYSYYASIVFPPVYRVIVVFAAHVFVTLYAITVQLRIARQEGVGGILVLAIASVSDVLFAPLQMALLYFSPTSSEAADILKWFQPLNAALLCVLQTFGYTLLTASRTQRELRQMALMDLLTGVPNRRAFEATFKRAIAHTKRSGGSGAGARLGLIVLDVDHFKRINDTHGHTVGDLVLRHLADTISATLRGNDFFARVGGEEFALVVKDTTAEILAEVAERVRHAVASAPLQHDNLTLPCTISAGAALSPPGAADFDALYSAADAALYQAKNAGRNRVVMGSGSEE